ncbi:MAG: His/Gly/Thr/Pro-type tRNA ligase C-terminal domain-containing protein [Saprospiraceae bacterium]
MKNNSELTDAAEKLFKGLKAFFNVQYDDKDTIGRRYRRQDAIGTPYCVTLDFQTLEDNTVTVRDRDSLRASQNEY